MISIPQAVRVWKRLLLMKDYPFPPERKWLVGILLYGWAFGPFFVGAGILLGTGLDTRVHIWCPAGVGHGGVGDV